MSLEEVEVDGAAASSRRAVTLTVVFTASETADAPVLANIEVIALAWLCEADAECACARMSGKSPFVRSLCRASDTVECASEAEPAESRC